MMEFPEEEYDVIVDAVFGVGLKREVAGQHREVIERMNQKKALKVAVDVPSGVDASTGQILGIASVSYTHLKTRALLTFLGDALKSFVPVLIVKFVLCPAVPDLNAELIQLVTGFAAVMGHDYPVFLKFKGGKGIATTAAAMMAFDWRIGLCCFIIFVTVTAAVSYTHLLPLPMNRKPEI